MAFDLPGDLTSEPSFTVVSEYGVSRIGDAPSASITLQEVCYLLAPQAVVDSAVDMNDDGKREVLNIGAFGTLDPDTLVGKLLALPSGKTPDLGAIASATTNLITPAVLDEQGNVITPAVVSMVVTLATPPSADLTGATIGVVQINEFGGPVYYRPSRGRSWRIGLSGSDPSNFAQMVQSMGMIFVGAIAAGLTELGLSATQEQIVAAVQSLATKGTTIDSLWADAAASVELARRSGFKPSMTMGAPPVA